VNPLGDEGDADESMPSVTLPGIDGVPTGGGDEGSGIAGMLDAGGASGDGRSLVDAGWPISTATAAATPIARPPIARLPIVRALIRDDGHRPCAGGWIPATRRAR